MNSLTSIPLVCAFWRWSPLSSRIVSATTRCRFTRKLARYVFSSVSIWMKVSVQIGMSFLMFSFQGKLPGAFYRVGDVEAQRFIGKCLVPASKRVSARELLLDPFLTSDESWMVYARGARNLKPFLNEDEMDRLKLEDDDLGRTQMTITGKLNAEDKTIFLKVQIEDENGNWDC